MKEKLPVIALTAALTMATGQVAHAKTEQEKHTPDDHQDTHEISALPLGRRKLLDLAPNASTREKKKKSDAGTAPFIEIG